MAWGSTDSTAASKPSPERVRWARCPECKAIVLEQDIQGHDNWHAETDEAIARGAGVELIEWPAELDA